MTFETEGVFIDVNGAISDLMEVAKVAIGPHTVQIPEADAKAALEALLKLVERTMPAELQAQDRRVLVARHLVSLLR